MRGEGSKMSVFVHAQGIKTVHAVGGEGGQTMPTFCPRNCWMTLLGHLHSTYLEATHIENNDIIKEAKSVSKWAASVAMAKLFAQIPPTISSTMKNRHKILAKISRFRAFLSIPPSRSPVWQCRSVVVEIERNVIDFYPHFSIKAKLS